MTTPRLFLLRHAETEANSEQVWHGDTDTELSEHGLSQIGRLADSFHQVIRPDVIYASPLKRARLTAEGIAGQFGLLPKLDPRLMEMSMGEWEGVSYQDLHVVHDAFGQLRDNPNFRAPGGESPLDVISRMTKAIEEISKAREGENVVIVSHGIAMAFAIAHIVHDDPSRWTEFASHNTAISELCLKKRELVFFNRTDHLK